jgi:hypothetical protein
MLGLDNRQVNHSKRVDGVSEVQLTRNRDFPQNPDAAGVRNEKRNSVAASTKSAGLNWATAHTQLLTASRATVVEV